MIKNANSHTQPESHDSKKDFFRTSLEICQISAESFYMLTRKQDHKIFAVIMKDIEKALKSKTYVDSQFFILKELHDIINTFEKQHADKLVLHHENHDFKIELESEKTSSFESLYDMSCDELMILQQYLDKHLAKE